MTEWRKEEYRGEERKGKAVKKGEERRDEKE